MVYDLVVFYGSQDFTGVPAVVDLACMRDAMNNLKGDSNKINPLVSYIYALDFLVVMLNCKYLKEFQHCFS